MRSYDKKLHKFLRLGSEGCFFLFFFFFSEFFTVFFLFYFVVLVPKPTRQVEEIRTEDGLSA